MSALRWILHRLSLAIGRRPHRAALFAETPATIAEYGIVESLWAWRRICQREQNREDYKAKFGAYP